MKIFRRIILIIFGLLAILISSTVLIWVAFNLFIAKQPDFEQPSPLLIVVAVFAYFWIFKVGLTWIQGKSLKEARTILIPSPKIGFLNLQGDIAKQVLLDDKSALGPLFSISIASDNKIPICDVLILYCDLEKDGGQFDSDIGSQRGKIRQVS